MSSLDTLLRAALSEAEDLPRLVLADWLEENGQAERAELVRIQCELARWVPDLAQRSQLQERERSLLAAYQAKWLGPFHGRTSTAKFVRGWIHLALPASRFISAPRRLSTQPEDWHWVERCKLEAIGDSMTRLAGCEHLQFLAELDLAGTRLTNGQLNRLLASPHLSELRGLDLANNLLTDASVEPLLQWPGLARLRWLDLRNNRLSAAAARRLAGGFSGGWLDVHGHGPTGSRGTLLAWVGQRPGRLVNSLGMDFALIPAGTFLMGSSEDEPSFEQHEGPRHVVRITRPFWMGVYPVTQDQYLRVMGNDPAAFNPAQYGGNALTRPVEQVSWEDARDFCRRLSALPREREAGRSYRLPTEAEWEYACRAGTTSPFWWGTKATTDRANFDGETFGLGEGVFLQTTTPVGQYQPNGFGLYDVAGNVWEWCNDWYGPTYYRRSKADDPRGPGRGGAKVIRGGCWNGAGQACRSSRRLGEAPDASDFVTGFRVALTVKEPSRPPGR